MQENAQRRLKNKLDPEDEIKPEDMHRFAKSDAEIKQPL